MHDKQAWQRDIAMFLVHDNALEYGRQDELRALFEDAGFHCNDVSVHERRISNHAHAVDMDRRWIQATFSWPSTASGQYDTTEADILAGVHTEPLEAQRAKSAAITLTDECACKSSYNRRRVQGCCEGGHAVATPLVSAWAAARDPATAGNGSMGQPRAVTVPDWQAEWEAAYCSQSSQAEPEEALQDMFDEGEPAAQLQQLHVQGIGEVEMWLVPRENGHTLAHTGLMVWEGSLALARLIAACPGIFTGVLPIVARGCPSVLLFMAHRAQSVLHNFIWFAKFLKTNGKVDRSREQSQGRNISVPGLSGHPSHHSKQRTASAIACAVKMVQNYRQAELTLRLAPSA